MSAGILVPVRFDQADYDIEVTVGVTTETLTLSVVPGRDYWLGGDDIADSTAGDGDLLKLLQDTLNTHPGSVDVTVSLDAQKRVVVDNTAGGDAVNLLWANKNTTLDATIFGFEQADTSAALIHTGANRSFGWWLPNSELAFDSRDRQPVLRGKRRSMLGRVKVTEFGATAKMREVSFEFLLQAVVLTEYELATNTAFEGFWTEYISKGRRFRLYPDITTNAFSTYTIDDLRDPMTRNEQYPTRWNIRLMMRLAGLAFDDGSLTPPEDTDQGFGAGSFGAGSAGS